MNKIQIILVDWSGYPLSRTKKLGNGTRIKCGISRILKGMNKYNAGAEFECTLVINEREESPNKASSIKSLMNLKSYFNPSRSDYQALNQMYPFLSNVYFRGNIGQDIGAYNFGFQKLISTNHSGDVLFMNSSVSGPSNNGWLLNYQKMLHEQDGVGLCGISMNSDLVENTKRNFLPHIQSFFLYSNMEILQSVFGENIPGSKVDNDKDLLIKNGEVQISTEILDAGYALRSKLNPEFIFYKEDEWKIPYGDPRFSSKYKSQANKC